MTAIGTSNGIQIHLHSPRKEMVHGALPSSPGVCVFIMIPLLSTHACTLILVSYITYDESSSSCAFAKLAFWDQPVVVILGCSFSKDVLHQIP